MLSTSKEPIFWWSPTSGQPHEDDFKSIMVEWHGKEWIDCDAIANLKYVQEQVEAKAESNGQPFHIVKATPRWLRYQLERHELEFTETNVHVFIATLASQPGFDFDRVYDLQPRN